MELKRIAAGVLAAATVFTASTAVIDNGVSLFSQTALTAEAASNIIKIDSTHYSVDGILYSLAKSAKTASAYGFYKGQVKSDLTIPGTITIDNVTYKVTTISSRAFEKTAVKKVDLSGAYNLTDIYTGAFMSCDKLTTVKIGSNLRHIQYNTFFKCTKLSNFDFGGNNNLNMIEDKVFFGCTALKSIKLPQSIMSISGDAFSRSGLTSVEIPNGVRGISSYAFEGCQSLTTVTFKAGSSNGDTLTLGSRAFGNCPNLILVNLYRDNINAAVDVFTGASNNLSMQGYGSTSYTQSICKKLLNTWGLTYKSSYSNSQKKKFFTDLGKKVGSYIAASRIKERGCAATVISLKQGTCGGYARVFYNCCIAAGVSKSDVLVGGDSHCHAWNYVKYGGYWYQVDCGWSRFCEDAAQYYALVGTWKDDGKDVWQHEPENWIVCVDNMTGAEDENHYSNPFCKNFDQVLREGSANGIPVSGKRAGYPIKK